MDAKDLDDDFKGLKITENQDINILLLGESGVGKSTFINAIANYLHFKHYKKASKEELLVLIPSVITVTNEQLEQVTITVGSDNNEYQEVGAAGTQDVKTYVFPIGEGKTRLRLIDSPGMADPRGVQQDDINCENILAYLAQLKELHAICFLMKPTNTRITVLFEYCVKQILSRLEKSASRNIIFIFTNTRGSNYTPGDTLPCLKKVIEEIKARPPHVDIPLKTNIFSLDNEAFRFLVANKHGLKFDESVQQRFIESWNNSSRECWRLISYIVGDASNDPLKPHQMQNTTSINEARRLITQLSQPLADISQLIYDNIRILEKHKYNLKMDNQSLDELKKKLFIPIINLEVTQLTQPVTVCTSTKCADVVKVGDVNKWHYRQRCHDPCYLTNVTKEFVGDPSLAQCAAMSGRNCMKCTCDYTVHMHVYYMTKTMDDKIVDDVVQKNIQKKEMALQEAQRLVHEIDKRKKELEEERDTIIKTTAQFAHFLQHNAISPFNDSYKEYIEYLITREKSLGYHGDKETIYSLEQLLQQYDEIKAAFDNSLKLNEQYGLNAVISSVEPKSIIDSIHKLYQLKHNGKKIHELFKKQKASRNFEYDKNCEYVHPKPTKVYKDKKKDKSKNNGKSSDDDKGSKKNKKKDGSKTDDDRGRKKDKKKDGSKTDDERKGKFNKGPHYQNRNSRNPRDPPPPYPGHNPISYREHSRPFSGPTKNTDGEPNVVVKVEFNKDSKHGGNTDYSPYARSDSYHGHGPDPYYDQYRPTHGQYHGPSQHPGPYGPPQGHYYGQYQGPPQGPYQGPPQGPYRGPSQGPYYESPQGSYHGPTQGSYQGPPASASYYGPPQGHYHGPLNQHHESDPRLFQGPARGKNDGRNYQKNRQEYTTRGRPFSKRGGGWGRGRSNSKNRYGQDKKSGTEKSRSSSSDSSD